MGASNLRPVALIALVMAVVMIGCGAAPTPTPQPTPTAEPAQPSVSLSSLPGITLLAGQADTCAMNDGTKSTLLGFDARFQNINEVRGTYVTITDEDGTLLTS
ncbi:MAG: hypothetical protein AAF125_12575, partial [Chloroflexota bacterium]